MAPAASSIPHQVVHWRGSPLSPWLNRGGFAGVLFAVANTSCEVAKVPQSNMLLGNFPFRALILMQQLHSGDRIRACLTGTATLLLLFPGGAYAAAIVDLYLAATYFKRSGISESKPYDEINGGLNPSIWEDACKLLEVPEEQANQSEFVRSQWDKKRSSWQARETHKKAPRALADVIHRYIERLDTAYQTLTTPRESQPHSS